eukprot:NODE_4284_length_1194_cov_22.770308_g3780_i0.p1 GENE.NODE_4284_length_1194_cov_22.770308_g3780_i0~~NODE_4284_length_1194_cov_22.770308_g3780_i0.p1  ORF type:complete len:186 (+),score=32.18 NODE_4284_length_1194_cov_22.770308_g3780_i0:76-633(+)
MGCAFCRDGKSQTEDKSETQVQDSKPQDKANPPSIYPPPQKSQIRTKLDEELDLPSVPIIDPVQAFNQCGSLEFFAEIMQHYKEQYSKRTIFTHFQDRNWEQLGLEAHSLKGASANLFILQIQKICLACEKAGKAYHKQLESNQSVTKEEIERVFVLLEILEEAYQRFEKEVNEILRNPPAEFNS